MFTKLSFDKHFCGRKWRYRCWRQKREVQFWPPSRLSYDVFDCIQEYFCKQLSTIFMILQMTKCCLPRAKDRVYTVTIVALGSCDDKNCQELVLFTLPHLLQWNLLKVLYDIHFLGPRSIKSFLRTKKLSYGVLQIYTVELLSTKPLDTLHLAPIAETSAALSCNAASRRQVDAIQLTALRLSNNEIITTLDRSAVVHILHLVNWYAIKKYLSIEYTRSTVTNQKKP